MMRLLKLLVVSGVLTMLLASAAMAQEVVKDQENTESVWAQARIDSTQTQAQTITTATGGVIDSIAIRVGRHEQDPGPLCADLWRVENDTPVEKEHLLGCMDPPENVNTAGMEKIEFNTTPFDTPYMRPGEQYAIVLHNDSPEGQGYYWQFAQEFNNSGQPDSTFCADKLYTRGTAFSALYSGYPAVEWNRAACADFHFITYMTVDTTAPTGTVKINNGADRTTARRVLLSFSVNDPNPESRSGVDVMRFKNAGPDTVWSAWEGYDEMRYWNLTPGQGKKGVYVQFRDYAGNVSAKAYDTIVFKR